MDDFLIDMKKSYDYHESAGNLYKVKKLSTQIFEFIKISKTGWSSESRSDFAFVTKLQEQLMAEAKIGGGFKLTKNEKLMCNIIYKRYNNKDQYNETNN
ncbi:hypothetical protein HOE22_10925 [Candidatus Woesearchaeota archaeon]|jgi:hypothetical protein|nr:hypothetical protein [Candidatus Woesearchaeota archaeon]MBT4733053.1 hypothetical protein [Candidatus Woesearchaeota archaeon]MBT7558776.1 hypothetical protein [Candidatus Woesearchaeota archaeon]